MTRNRQICSIPGCGKLEVAKRLCPMHYARNRLYGDPLVTKCTPNGEVQRYFNEVVLTYDSPECLEWPYNKYKGYGLMYWAGRQAKAYRLVCEHFHGTPTPPANHTAHSCGNPGCVNWRHLRWATNAENMEDKIRHGRSRRGELNHNTKITESQAREILSLRDTISKVELARRYGVSASTVSLIHSGRNWSWL